MIHNVYCSQQIRIISEPHEILVNRTHFVEIIFAIRGWMSNSYLLIATLLSMERSTTTTEMILYYDL